MARLGILAAMALLALGTARVPAQDAAPATRPSDVAVLIERLDSDDFATREAATEQIALLGEEARPALLLAREAGSLERRMLIDQILNGLAARAASRPDRKVATFVTLEVADKPLSEACAILSRASGYAVRIPTGTDPAVTVSVREVPFFQALDTLCAQASRKADWDPKERVILLMPTTDKPPPTVYAGPMRVSLVMLSVNRQLRFGAAPLSSASLQIRVDYEEKARALGILVPLRAKILVDDRQRDLRGPDYKGQGSQSYLQRGDQRRQLQAYLPMAAPEPDAKAIARLEVILPVLIASESWEAQLGSPAEGLEVVQGPFRARIDSWKPGPAQSEIAISMSRPTLPPVGASNVPVQDDVVTFLSADGRTIQPISTAMTGSPGAGGIVMTFALPPGVKIASAEISSLKRVDLIEVPVVFENVPLP